MAKNKKFNIDTEFDFDSNFGFDQFDIDFGIIDKPDDRKPVTKVLSSIPSGMKSGVRDVKFMKDVLKNLLPKGYGQAIDLSDKVTENIKKVYEDSLKEAKPAWREFKRVAPKLVSAENKKLPKKAQELLKQWQEESQNQSKDLSPEQMREAMLSQQLADIFKVQTEMSVKSSAEEEARARMQQGIEIARHRDIFGLSNRQAISLSNIEKYITTIDLTVKKKSLELQYRQLHATREILDLVKTNALKHEESLAAIAKNTSLPDYVKLQDKEIIKLTMKNKFADNFTKSLFGDRNSFIEDIIKKASDRITNSVREFSQGLQDGLTELEFASDMDMGGDKYVRAGQMLGETGVQFLGKQLASSARSKLVNSKLGKKLQLSKRGTKLERFIENLPNKITDFKKKDFTWDEGPMTILGPLLQNLLPGGPDKQLDISNSKNILGPAPFTRRTDKSINEVIPGYLARILREVQVLRTGNDKIDLIKYDYDSNRFTGTRSLSKSIYDNIITKSGIKGLNTDLNTIFEDIEQKTGQKLDPGTKKVLRLALMKNSFAKRSNTLENLLSHDLIGSEQNKNITSLMSNYYGKMSDEDRLIFDRRHNNLANNIVDSREFIQNQVDVGNLSELRKMGFVGRKGQINTDRIIDLYVNNKDNSLGDIFISGNPNPVITKIKMKAKEYYDKGTGKVINSISDIKGSVVDRMGRLVLDADEIRNAVVQDNESKTFKKLTEFTNTFKTSTSNFKEYLSNKTLDLYSRFKQNTSSKNYAPEQLDLFVENELSPRLKEIKIRAGDYRDKVTGEVITSYKDIVNDVVDEKGNTVLDKTEVSRLRIFDPSTNMFKKIIDYNYSQPLSEVKNSTFKFFSNVKNKFMEGFRGLSDSINDVYVKGEQKPRILAVKLKQGLYTQKESGEVLNDIRMIEDDILDEEGKTVISKEEIPRLVVFEPNIKTWTSIKFLGKVARGLWWYQTKVAPKWTMWNLRQLGKVAILAKDIAMVGVRGFVKDVYVGDEKEPRMYAARMKQGYYFLKSSGKEITHQEQITDEVVDKFGNVVIAYEELENLRVYTSIFKWINPFFIAKKIAKGAFKLGMAVAKSGFKVAKWATSTLAKVGMKALDSTINFLTKPVDVYLSTKDKPVILARDLTEGKYYSAKTGKQLFHHRDIDGAVLDQDGKTVLTEEEAQSGLFDITGKKIRPGLIGILGKGLKKLNKLFAIRTKLNNGKFVPKNEADAEKQGMSRSDFLASKTMTAAESIKDILDKKFNKKKILGDADGDGDRDGSYADKIAKAMNKQKPDQLLDPKNNKVKDDKDKGFFGSLLTMLSTVAAGIASKLSGFLNIFNKGALGIVGQFARSGMGMVGTLVSAMMKMLPGLASSGAGLLKGAGGLLSKGLKIGRMAAIPAAVGMAAGYAVDGIAGKFGVGKNADGTDINIDQAADDANWEKMSTWQKVKSGTARGLEYAGDFMFMDNIARAAKANRIKNETAALSGVDEEDSQLGKGSAGIKSKSTKGTGPLKLASGQLYDGRNALAYLSLGQGVTLKNLNPSLQKLFYGMVEEYGVLTGKKVAVTAGSRTYEEQEALYKKYGPGRAAKPGNSLHEFGLAFDVDSKTLDEMESLGLMRKYGLTRPVGSEPWHVEPIGIQGNISYYKRNLGESMLAIKAGAGKGGGGLGILADAPKFGRDSSHSEAIMQAQASVVDNTKNNKPSIVAQAKQSIVVPEAKTQLTSNADLSNNNTFDRLSTKTNELDSEFKLASYGNVGSGLGKQYSTSMPKDPTVKIPDGDIQSIVHAAAKTVGISPDILLKTVAVESGFDPNAKSKNSSASGLFQFTDDTWNDVVRKHGNKYGFSLATASPFDPKANALMGAHYIKDNISGLTSPNGQVSATDAYLTLFLGPNGAKKFLTALRNSPNEIGSKILPEAAKANRDIFYAGSLPRTISQIYSLLQTRVNTKAASFGVQTSSSDIVLASAKEDNKYPGGGYTNAISSIKTPLEKTEEKKSSLSYVRENQSPINQTYGSSKNVTDIGNNNNSISPEVMANTEKILTASYNVQNNILSEIKNIRNLMTAKAEADGVNVPKDNTTTKVSPKPLERYDVPDARVRMSKSA